MEKLLNADMSKSFGAYVHQVTELTVLTILSLLLTVVMQINKNNVDYFEICNYFFSKIVFSSGSGREQK